MRVYKGPNIPSNEPIVNPSEIQGRSARQKNHSVGRVNLFEDEQTLSADGRLEPGRYEFNFDLLFPSKGLPSSIDVCKFHLLFISKPHLHVLISSSAVPFRT